MKTQLTLPSSWQPLLSDALDNKAMQQLKAFLTREEAEGKQIYPPAKHRFAAFEATPLEDTRVVILGQDPYHGTGQAHGLSFSVPPDIKPPPSLKNIFKALHNDLDYPIASSGCLLPWAQQGVLLLNSVLTVEAGKAASHQKKGWELFTDQVIEGIDASLEHVVFLLWGNYAERKGALINRKKHLVLTAPHPSPLSAHRGFMDCGHFSKTNNYLLKHGKTPVNWQLPL